MTERRDTPDEGDALLAAWLDGELDEVTDRRVRAWLDADPALAGRLATTHDTVVALGGVDDVEPPAGYEARLRARLADERAARARPWLSRGRSRPRPGGAAPAVHEDRAKRHTDRRRGPAHRRASPRPVSGRTR